jgi:hypothetical protein
MPSSKIPSEPKLATSKDRPFVCRHCPNRFLRAEHLKRHERYVFRDKRPPAHHNPSLIDILVTSVIAMLTMPLVCILVRSLTSVSSARHALRAAICFYGTNASITPRINHRKSPNRDQSQAAALRGPLQPLRPLQVRGQNKRNSRDAPLEAQDDRTP